MLKNKISNKIFKILYLKNFYHFKNKLEYQIHQINIKFIISKFLNFMHLKRTEASLFCLGKILNKG